MVRICGEHVACTCARACVCACVNRCVCQRTTPTALALTATPRWPQSTSDLKATHARGCVRLSFRGTTTGAAKAVGAFGPSSDLKATHARGCVRVRFRRTTTRAAKAVCAFGQRQTKSGKGRVCVGQRPKPKATVFFCTSLRTAPTVSSGVLVRSTDTKLRHENRETHAGMAIFANPEKRLKA